MVYKQEADNTWDSIWQAVVNALVIVIFIGLMNFVMVILYKYHCVKVLYALLYFCNIQCYWVYWLVRILHGDDSVPNSMGSHLFGRHFCKPWRCVGLFVFLGRYEFVLIVLANSMHQME